MTPISSRRKRNEKPWQNLEHAVQVLLDSFREIETIKTEMSTMETPTLAEEDLRPVPLKNWDPGPRGWPGQNFLRKLHQDTRYDTSHPFRPCFGRNGNTVLFHPKRFWETVEQSWFPPK